MRSVCGWLAVLVVLSVLQGVGVAAPSGRAAPRRVLRFRDYLVRINFDDSCDILRQGRVLRQFHPFTSLGGPYDSGPWPRNLTGSGPCDLVLHETRGASGGRYTVLHLGPSLQVMQVMDGGVSTRLRFQDLDADGVEEAIYGQRYLFGKAIYQEAVLRWRGGQYRTAFELMRAPAPSAEILRQRSRGLRPLLRWKRQHEDPPTLGGVFDGFDSAEAREAFIKLAEQYLHLLASGHPDLAGSFLNQAWADPTGRKAFRRALRARLKGTTLEGLLPSFVRAKEGR